MFNIDQLELLFDMFNFGLLITGCVVAGIQRFSTN
jgi:hypothetical protein